MARSPLMNSNKVREIPGTKRKTETHAMTSRRHCMHACMHAFRLRKKMPSSWTMRTSDSCGSSSCCCSSRWLSSSSFSLFFWLLNFFQGITMLARRRRSPSPFFFLLFSLFDRIEAVLFSPLTSLPPRAFFLVRRVWVEIVVLKKKR